ncbi:MAG: DNA-processing protein DprA [Dehalococcoidia bacterium]|nr:DNA-processing protein DprA [Dehalococcoidia bacterium]MCA9857530.1 DNA-processing protein DprA [Dehalococcoidia bacterium]MCB9483549.1 DNA-protecting protein DprA [Dehalococcoidia bacterium]
MPDSRPDARSSAPADLAYRVALHRIHRLGSVRFGILERAFPDLRDAWRASEGDLVAGGLDARTAQAIVRARTEADPESEIDRLESSGTHAFARVDPAYPSRLREIDDAPPVLYVRGTLSPDDDYGVAVVGTRRATAYGRQATAELSRGLAAAGVTIVSGLARGVDTIAHRTALDTGGRTIAVLANGLDTIYPPENRRLAEEITEHGAIVSDYPLGTKPRADFFPRRNRILSGLSLGTLVIEGDVKSGAMITAKFATEQNRDVFAVPGSIFSPQSRGPLSLIRDGAMPISSAQEILEALNLARLGAQLDFGRAAPPASDEERTLMGVLTREPQHIDEVARQTGLAAAMVSGTLALLELKGLVRDVGGLNFVRVREDDAPYSVEETEDGRAS